MQNNNKKNFVQVSKYYYPFCGGIEAVAKQIADTMKKNEYNVEVFACSQDINSSEDFVDDIPIKRCGVLTEFKANPISINLIWRLSRVKADVLHYQHPFVFAAIAHFIARPKYKKLTLTYCSDVVKQKYIMKVFNPIFERFLKEADKIHILAPNMIESSKTLAKFKEKCVTVPYSIDISKYQKINNEKVKQIKERFPNKKILLFVGRLIYYKGISILIDAMKNVNEDTVLIIIGIGKLEEELKKQVNDLNLYNRIFFEGQVSDEDLLSYYHACDIFVFPSIAKSEAYGISQLEAMSCGKPVINTWLHTGVNFISINEVTGITIQPLNVEELTNAINLLIFNDDLRLKYGVNARKRIEEVFNLEKVENNYLDFFNGL